MLVEIDAVDAIPGEMIEQMQMTIEFIEEFKDKEYLESYQVEDLEYDLALLPALRSVAKHYSIHTDFPAIDEYQVPCDIDVVEFETSDEFEDL